MKAQSVRAHLDVAERHLPSRPEPALRALVEGYALARNTSLGDAVVGLSAKLSTRPSALRGVTGEKELARTWARLAKSDDPLDVEPLLHLALDGSPGEVPKRVGALGRRRTDPRISRWIVAAIARGAFTHDDARQAAMVVLYGMGDPTIAPALRAALEDGPARVALTEPFVERALKATRLWGPEGALTETEQAQLARIVGRIDEVEISSGVSAPAPASDAEPLARATRILEDGGDVALAIAALVEAWQARPLASIAERIEAATRLAPPRPPLPRLPREEALRIFFDLEQRGDVGDTPRLVAILHIGTSKEVTARIEHLTTYRADPRIVGGLLQLLSMMPFSATSAYGAYAAAFKALAKLGDARALPRLLAIRASLAGLESVVGGSFLGRFSRDAERLIAALGKEPPLSPRPEEAASLERIDRALGRRVGSADEVEEREASLLAEIYARPDDDDARLVYADWLSQRGDPRGELIALTCPHAPAQGPAAARSREIVATFGHTLLGPLAPAVVPTSAVFERGFVSDCRIASKRTEAAARIVEHPAWSTLRAYSIVEPDCERWADLRRHLARLGVGERIVPRAASDP